MTDDSAIPARRRVYLGALRRVSDIHREIASGTYPDVARLASKLGVTSRTVKRDLDVMRDSLNAPIVYERRKRGFRYTDPGWALPLERVTEGEMLAFFIAENALRLTGQTSEAVLLKSALAKIAAMLPDEVSISISSLGETASFQNLPATVADPVVLEHLARSAISRQSIEIDYFSPHSGQATTRTIDPHFLHNFAGDWYVIAHDHLRNDMRDFHAGRIRALRVLERYFTVQKKWNAAEYLKKGFYMTRGGRLTMVVLHFDPYQAQWIRERHYFHPDEQRRTAAYASHSK